MTVILFSNDESETQTTASTWVTKLSVSGTLGTSGHFITWISAEFTGSATNKVVAIRALLDGTERAFDAFIPPTTSLYRSFSSMGLIDLSEGEHSLEIQFTCGTTPTTASIRRARILLMKH